MFQFLKHNKTPQSKVHKLDNVSLALDMVSKADIKTNFLKPNHLVDKDLKMILGMIWAIILDYQIKGISEDELTAREGLLLWCQKKTAGYKDVKVDNFTNSWQNGLAFCALIHRHRPDLLDYNQLDKANAEHNLELAFSVAEKHLGIARLLDIEDLTQVAKPDERSVMTYVSEYFHCFSALDFKEKSGRRIKKFVEFNQGVEKTQAEYERGATDLLRWIDEQIRKLSNRNFADDVADANNQFNAHKKYISAIKPEKSGQKLDLESTFVSIQTKLKVNGRHQYNVPHELSPEAIDTAWEKLADAEKEREKAVRNNMFRFITKSTTGDVTAEQLAEFEAIFDTFDKDKDTFLNQVEFKAALSAVGVGFPNEDAFLKIFRNTAGGGDKISKDQFVKYMIEISADKDTAEQIKDAFRSLADHANSIALPQLRVHPLENNDIDYLGHKMPKTSDVSYDYSAYVDSVFADKH